MPRIRSVHPGLFTDEAFVEVSEAAQIFLVGLWTQSDDFGIFEWKPLQLRMRLRPTKDGAVDPLLAELAGVDLIRQFAIEARQYGAIRNFCRFQRPKKPKSLYPISEEFRTYVALSEASTELGDDEGLLFTEPDGGDGDAVPKKSEMSPQREEIRGRRLEGGGRRLARARAPPKQKTAFPGDFGLNEPCRQYAAERNFSAVETERMFERFKNHHTAKGSTFVSWEAAWRTWVGNQVEFNQERRPVAKAATWDPGL